MRFPSEVAVARQDPPPEEALARLLEQNISALERSDYEDAMARGVLEALEAIGVPVDGDGKLDLGGLTGGLTGDQERALVTVLTRIEDRLDALTRVEDRLDAILGTENMAKNDSTETANDQERTWIPSPRDPSAWVAVGLGFAAGCAAFLGPAVARAAARATGLGGKLPDNVRELPSREESAGE